MKSRLCLRILLLRAYDAINDGADTFFRVLVFAAMKPAYAKASAFADAAADKPARQAETTGTGPARCAFSVGLEFGDRPCEKRCFLWGQPLSK